MHDSHMIADTTYPADDLSNPVLFQLDTWQSPCDSFRKSRPIYYCESSPNGPHWSVTRYADIKEIEMDPQTFSSAQGGVRIDGGLAYSFLSSDPPRHTRERKMVSSISNPLNLARYEVLIRDRTRQILSGLARNEVFDWNSLVSSELSSMMLATLFDLPLDARRKLSYWSDVASREVTSPDALVHTETDRTFVISEMMSEFRTLLRERSVQEPKLDLISLMAHNPTFFEMTEDQAIGNLVLLVIGGYDTTKSAMSGGVLELSQRPDQRRAVINDPALIPNLVDEIIRFQTPLIHTSRTATCDYQLHEKTIRKGDRVALWYVSGNRDEEIFKDPHQFVVSRSNASKHLSFGAGIHYCIGARLAKAQIRILWEEIIDQGLTVNLAGEPKRLHSNFTRGFTSLPVIISS